MLIFAEPFRQYSTKNKYKNKLLEDGKNKDIVYYTRNVAFP